MSSLENCTVIEGYLHISFIEHGKTEEFAALTFPKLREITAYFLLYRVSGLETLSALFPNLAVIRGQVLFYNYALVMFEMQDMVDIGLIGLTTISRGAVRLEKNPKLCYIDMIDWTKIRKEQAPQNVFMLNKAENECANVCPMKPKCATHHDDDHDLCWNANHCQIGKYHMLTPPRRTTHYSVMEEVNMQNISVCISIEETFLHHFLVILNSWELH